MTDATNENNCDVCGCDLAGKTWLMLNRYALGTGTNRCMSEVLVDNEYEWSPNEDGAASDEYATGWTMCWPGCAQLFIDCKMAEVDAELRLRGSR